MNIFIKSLLLSALLASSSYGAGYVYNAYEPEIYEPEIYDPSQAHASCLLSLWLQQIPIDWQAIRYVLQPHLAEAKIQALEDYCKGLRSFDKVQVTRFLEFKMSKSTKWTGGKDENAYVVKTYKEEVKDGDVIVFDVLGEHADMVSATKFVKKNRDKIAAIIVGWQSGEMSNFSKKRPSTRPEIMESCRRFFGFCKSVAPQIPVGVVVCRSRTWKAWLDACEFEYDFLAIWDVYKLRTNLEMYKRFFPGEKLFIAGMNAKGLNPEYGGIEYDKYIEKLKQSEEFIGLIWIKSQ